MANSILSESVSSSSDIASDMFCESCKKDEKDKFADGFCVNCLEYYCSTCLRLHHRFLPDHVIQDKYNMPQDFCLEPCEKHNNEVIKFYCGQCEELACSSCKVENHMSCRDLKHVPTIANKFDRSLEYKSYVNSIDHDEKRLDRLLHSVEERKKTTETFYNDAAISLKEQRREIDKELDKFEMKVETFIKQVRDEDLTTLDDILTRYRSLKTKLNDSKDKLTKAVNLGNKSQLFVCVKSTKHSILDEEHRIGKDTYTCRKYTYSPNEELLQTLQQTGTIGVVNSSVELIYQKDVIEMDQDTAVTIIDKGKEDPNMTRNKEETMLKMEMNYERQEFECNTKTAEIHQDIEPKRSNRNVCETRNHNVPRDIAVTGLAGAGVTTFIEALTGVTNNGEDNAMKKKNEIHLYPFSNNPDISIWDIPHVDNISGKRDSYFESMSIDLFSIVILVTSKRLTDDDVWLAKEIEARGKQVFLLRTKFGCDLRNEQKRLRSKSPLSNSEKVLLQERTIESYKKKLSNLKCKDNIFIVDCFEKSRFDFNVLQRQIMPYIHKEL